jgi:hypothetical protein
MIEQSVSMLISNSAFTVHDGALFLRINAYAQWMHVVYF